MTPFPGEIDSASADELAQYLGSTGTLEIEAIEAQEINAGNRKWRLDWNVDSQHQSDIRSIHSGTVHRDGSYSLTETLRQAAIEVNTILTS